MGDDRRHLHTAHVAAFAALPAEARRLVEDRLTPLRVARGTYLLRRGEAADALFVVLSGRFAVEAVVGSTANESLNDTSDDAVIVRRRVAEIASGELVGEIAFFTGTPRTADVRAIRDSVVAKLTRADFDAVAEHAPGVWQGIVATLAGRLADETRRATQTHSHALIPDRAAPRPRTAVLMTAGGAPLSPAFLTAFCETAPTNFNTCILSAATLADHLPGFVSGALSATAALNALEDRYDLVVFIADAHAPEWSATAIRHADEAIVITESEDGPTELSPLETLARQYLDASSHRLVIIHDRPRRIVSGSARLIANRHISQHHHVAIADIDSLARLWRFLTGTARGLVACGGGAFSAAHIGIYEATRQLHLPIDIHVGTSGGAAMAGAFAQGATPDEISEGVERMFVEGRALSRYALPRYGALDHTHFDAHLRDTYRDVAIEDLWLPYCAVACDLSDTSTSLIRSGPLWQAIRASAAIPGLLPPFYTRDGRMLVDGSVIANVPLQAAQALKNGPNVVVSFRSPEGQRFHVDYERLPGRREVLWKSLWPGGRATLPEAPSAANVLVRSLMADRDHFERHLTADDQLLLPPTPEDMNALDWRQHRALRAAACTYALEALSAA